jgi:hypothetical protein
MTANDRVEWQCRPCASRATREEAPADGRTRRRAADLGVDGKHNLMPPRQLFFFV